ncbi:MAG: hypothetical protein AAFP03_17905, partial [Cyanobacteria bacterium J06598_3]
MKLSSRQLPCGKWGIYSDTGLLATVNSQAICETIMANSATGRRDAPFDDANALYQVPELSNKSARQGAQLATSDGSTDNQRLERNSADAAAALKTSLVPTQGSPKQAAGKTAKKQAASAPLKG